MRTLLHIDIWIKLTFGHMTRTFQAKYTCKIGEGYNFPFTNSMQGFDSHAALNQIMAE